MSAATLTADTFFLPRLSPAPGPWHAPAAMGQEEEKRAAAPPRATASARGEAEGLRVAEEDEALMRAYVAGDKAAFRTLFDRYAPIVFRAMRSGGITEDVARDLMQQAFLQFHRARNDFRLGARLRPWLLTIAYNLKRDYLRGRKRRVELPIEPERHAGTVSGPDRDLMQVRDVARVRKAVAELPDNYREVVELHWFAELPFPEVAEVMGIKLNAAKVRAHRAYKKLREILEREAASVVPQRGSEQSA